MPLDGNISDAYDAPEEEVQEELEENKESIVYDISGLSYDEQIFEVRKIIDSELYDPEYGLDQEVYVVTHPDGPSTGIEEYFRHLLVLEAQKQEQEEHFLKRIFCSLIVLIVISGIAYVNRYSLKKFFASQNGQTGLTAKDFDPDPYVASEREIRRSVLSAAAQPGFVSKDFLEKVTGVRSVKFERWRVSKKRIYLSISREAFGNEVNPEDWDEICAALSIRPEAVTFGKNESGGTWSSPEDPVILEGLKYSAKERMLLGMDDKDLKCNPDTVLEYPFGDGGITFNISLRELDDFISNRTIHGGRLSFPTQHTDMTASNHAAFVARAGEPSLKRLVNNILVNDEGMSDTEKAQYLLDFVTIYLKYNHKEANLRHETLKRPSEVLMTGGSDCSGLTIAYASLLEQARVDYYLVYRIPEFTPGHIAVLIKWTEADLPSNGQFLMVNGDRYVIAECTLPGFQIGKTQFKKGIGEWHFVQEPGKGLPIRLKK